MGRKNLSAERIPQILDAFERCIVKYGLAGSSLERVAQEAGVSRTLIHHYIGGRETLLEAMLERLTEEDRLRFDDFAAGRTNSDDANTLLDYFFGPWGEALADGDIIFAELRAAGTRDEAIRRIMAENYERFHQAITDKVRRFYPDAPAEQSNTVAYEIMVLVLGNAVMTDLKVRRPDPATLREAARALLEPLKRTYEER
jgi:AcrR family transcriptional regulator